MVPSAWPTVQGALADACLPGDRVELHLARIRDGLTRGRDDPGAVARGVGPEAGRVHRSPAGDLPVAAVVDVVGPARNGTLSWAILVRKSVGAVDGVEGLAQVVGDRVRGGSEQD
jgi:hypothetical protein